MNLLFVKSDKIGSRLIRWGTDEPASHVAVAFSDMVFHSYDTGIRWLTPEVFRKHYTIVDSLTLILTPEQEFKARRMFSDSLPERSTYDYFAIFYFTWRALLHKLFKMQYPRLNSWQDGEGFLCTEITYLVASVYAELTSTLILPADFDLAMVTPWQLRNIVKKQLGVASDAK